MAFDLDAASVDGYRRAPLEMEIAGFTIEQLREEYRPAIDWIKRIRSGDTSAEKAPSLPDLLSMFGHFEAQRKQPICVQTEIPARVLAEELLKRRATEQSISLLNEAYSSIRQQTPVQDVAATLQTGLQTLLTQGAVGQSIHELSDEIDAVLERIDASARGDDALRSPWPSFNQITKGISASTATWWMARPGMGKTWILTILTAFAWLQRFRPGGRHMRVLFVSPELNRAEAAERIFSFSEGISYGTLTRGADAVTREMFENAIRSRFSGQDGFAIMDQNDDLSSENIERVILTFEPDLVVIDSAYEIRWSKDRTEKERLDAGCTIMRRWARKAWPCQQHPPLWPYRELEETQARRKSIALLVSTQENRESLSTKGGGGAGAGSLQSRVGITDRIMWSADNLFALEQDQDDRANRHMKMSPVKVRRPASNIRQIVMEWDFERMIFNEVGVEVNEPVDTAELLF